MGQKIFKVLKLNRDFNNINFKIKQIQFFFAPLTLNNSIPIIQSHWNKCFFFHVTTFFSVYFIKDHCFAWPYSSYFYFHNIFHDNFSPSCLQTSCISNKSNLTKYKNSYVKLDGFSRKNSSFFLQNPGAEKRKC